MINLWTPDVLKIDAALDGQIRLVGGCVRDFILDKTPDDIDIATPLLPKTVLSCLKSSKILTKVIAPKHGVIMAIIGKNAYEITTLRQETYSAKNEEQISFIRDYAQDSIRRDFTINALYMDKNNTIYDYHNGLADLKEGQIRFIGNAFERLRQDPLRLLRYLRFWGDYGTTKPDNAILECFSTLGSGLKNISRGRKKKEMSKILKSKRASEILNLIERFNLWSFIAPNSIQPITQLKTKEILTQI